MSVSVGLLKETDSLRFSLKKVPLKKKKKKCVLGRQSYDVSKSVD